MDPIEALEQTKRLPAQTKVEIVRGLNTRRTQGGIPVHRLHYSALPQRDPEINPEWKASERMKYTSQASWDREQEIVDEAGGGELVFADTLVSFWDKIVIQDPKWRPDPRWVENGGCEAGFDHGKTNPTCLERCYIDHEGTLYFCGEYYMPGREISDHVPVLRQMADITKISACFADPSIFPMTMQQAPMPGRPQERAKSINELYVDHGFALFSPFAGDRGDVSFAARLMLHWANLDRREPTVKIVCSSYVEKPDPGLHNWSCPNLLWELMRTRRQKLTAQQLMTRNAAESIVDKDNHARDAMKYVLMSHPEPTLKSVNEMIQEHVAGLDPHSAYIRGIFKKEQLTDDIRLGEPFPMGSPMGRSTRMGRRRMFR